MELKLVTTGDEIGSECHEVCPLLSCLLSLSCLTTEHEAQGAGAKGAVAFQFCLVACVDDKDIGRVSSDDSPVEMSGKQPEHCVLL